jgi:methylated-DNA-[protein]-cysteine S-methyltransferase
MESRYRIIATAGGHVGIVVGERGLRCVYQVAPRAGTIRDEIQRDFADAVEEPSLWPELAEAIRRYFRGEPIEFDVDFDVAGHREFDIDVWNACRRIGYGKTVSYGSLADRVGRPGAARAVGSAMSRNPCPIVVPCHRVVKSDGSLGGYSGRGGLRLKRKLLQMEAGGAR